MTAGSWSSPARTSAGSPGSNCCIAKTSADTSSTVGPIGATRRNSQAPMKQLHPGKSPLVDAQPLRPDQPVGVGDEPGELFARRIQQFRMPQIDDRSVGKHLLGNFCVMGEALRPIAGRARGLQVAINLLVAIMRRVQRWRRVAGDKIIDI